MDQSCYKDIIAGIVLDLKPFSLNDDPAGPGLNLYFIVHKTDDPVIVLDIYAAREINTYNISSKDLVDKIISLGKDAKYIPDFYECVSFLKENVKENDIILTLGAGTVTQIGPMLLDNNT